MIAEAGILNSTGLKMTFDDIYKENADMVLNLAFRMTGKQEVARDLTQDVFIKVYEKSNSFREQSKLSTWIYRIAMNHILNFLKREKRIIFLIFWNRIQKHYLKILLLFGSKTCHRNPTKLWKNRKRK